MIRRRSVLRLIAGGALAACPVCAALAQEPVGRAWSYEGATGPANWGDMAGYRTCGVGAEQSPVDLKGPVPATLAPPEVHWRAMPLSVVNNGHTIEVTAPAGSFVVLDGRRFDLVQFHFHHPSEHRIDGRSFPLEAHFVHRAADGDLVVLGTFLTEGSANATLAAIWAEMPAKPGTARASGAVIRSADLLPASGGHYRYAGSLTTPPCSEIVSWVVYAAPVEVSARQVAAFAALFPGNARPLQPLGRRFLLGGF